MPKKVVIKKTETEENTKKDVKVTAIPEIKEKDFEAVETRAVTEPYTYVRLLYNKDANEYLYEIIEPQLSEEQKKTLDTIKNTLIESMDEGMRFATREKRVEYLKKNMDRIILDKHKKMDETFKGKIFYYIIRDLIGYGKIDVLMIDPMIEDVSCDGAKTPIYIYHRAHESMRTNILFNSDEELDKFVVTLAQKCGKSISIASPMLDATIPDGSRLQATLAREVTTRGSSFTIRRFKANPITPPDLVGFKTMSSEMMAYLWLAVQYGESMLISGGTASGKTTTLNAILLFIPPQMKIVSIEDTREINIPHENWIAGLTRSGFAGKSGETSGEIDMFELMRASLRQRPQYLIVGEVRGKEAFIIFQAMATGKATYSTIHADSVQAIVNRLENPPINLPRVLVAALNVVLLQASVKVGPKMTRRIKKIVEIVGLEPDTKELITNTIFEWNPADDRFVYLGHSSIFEKIAYLKNMTHDEVTEEFKRRTEIINWMLKKNVKNYKEVANILSAYYQEPEETIKKIRSDTYEK